MSDILALDSLVLDPRFNGPPSTANGGYACGAIGELVDGPAEVTLLSPPPLGVPLDVGFLPGGEVEVARRRRGRRARAAGRRASTSSRRCGRRSPRRARPRGATPATGARACSPTASSAARSRHDGLGIHFGPLRGHPGVTAAVFLPDATVPNRDGVVAPDMVWAALDCPSYTPPLWDWERPSLLARLAVERLDCVEVGEPVDRDSAGTSPARAASTTPPRRCCARRPRARARPRAVDHAGGQSTLT